MPDPLCLLSVHAHPDDESSKGAGTIARYHAEGVRTVLVTCTGGEEGDVLNPALDNEETKAKLPEIRLRELERAAAIIGYDEVVLLGYRDSGMEGSPSNDDPRCFAAAALDESVGKLVGIIRRVRPQVIITYEKEQREYRHPDHLRVNEITEIAFDKAGDESAYPELGEPFTPLKLYYSGRMRSRQLKRHAAFVELGIASPYEERIAKGLLTGEDPPTTTTIDLSGFESVRFDALLAHATQVDPHSTHWFGLPSEVDYAIHSDEKFLLARSRVGPITEEDDLFAGVVGRQRSTVGQVSTT